MIRTPKGETLVDFGQILVGNVRITVSGERGQKVHIKHGEMLDKEGNFYCENIAPSKQEVEYILSGEGTETYLPRFTFQDFRVSLRFWNSPESRRLIAFKRKSGRLLMKKRECFVARMRKSTNYIAIPSGHKKGQLYRCANSRTAENRETGVDW